MNQATEIRLLPVKLSTEELTLRGQELAQKHAELSKQDQETKTIKARWYRDRKAVQGEIERLAQAVNTGVEEREVEVVLEKDLEAKMLITRRLDTNEVVSSIPMQSRDLQLGIDDLPTPKAPKSPKSPKAGKGEGKAEFPKTKSPGLSVA